MRARRKSILVPTIFMAILLTLFLPGLGLAGSLEPSDPPAPTMKTLDQIPPTWSQKLQCDLVETIHGPRRVCPRFEVLADFNSEAVLDKETGLVWEKSPDQSDRSWYTAVQTYCYNKSVGNRKGWRLPTAEELASLVDSTRTEPALPAGHPFTIICTETDCPRYWTATTAPSGVSFTHWAVFVEMYFGDLDSEPKGLTHRSWCVRGGRGVDPQDDAQ
jgi:hypothetical protein